MGHNLPADLAARLKKLQRSLPPDTELSRMLSNLDDPSTDEASKDRYVGLVAAGAVEQALHLAVGSPDKGAQASTFHNLIERALKRGLVDFGQTTELHRIREVRNVFAHAPTSVSFATPDLAEVCKTLWHHPVTNWASYFAPIFPPRVMFAIACGEYFKQLSK